MHVKPLLVELTDDDLLEKCTHGKTQNQNESLNAMVIISLFNLGTKK